MVKREKVVLSKEDVAKMFSTVRDLKMFFYSVVVLILSRMGLREAELVGQRPQDAYCRCELCKLLKREPETGILKTRISSDALNYIQTWTKEPKGKPRTIKFNGTSWIITIKDLDTTPEERIAYPANLLPDLRNYVALAHYREPLPGLRVKDIDFVRSKVRIYGKGYSSSRSPVRTLDVEPEVLTYIHEYIQANGIKPDDRIVPLSTRRVREIVKEAAFLAEIPDAKLVAPHRLRAFYITEIAREASKQGLAEAIKIAQENAGHASSSTTMLYIGVTPERKKEVARSAFKTTKPAPNEPKITEEREALQD